MSFPAPSPSRTVVTRPARALVLAAVVTLLAVLGALPADPASASVPARSASHAASVGGASIADLALTGTTTRVTVRRVYRNGQAQWINGVLDSRLVNINGCQARRATGWRGHVYRASVYAVCPAGPAAVETAARALTRSRPWYRVSVDRVPLVGFTLLAALPSGNGEAVPAATAQLPAGPSVFFEGDDVSLSYAGPGVTQAQLDAAVAAFAQALGIPASKVTVTPLANP